MVLPLGCHTARWEAKKQQRTEKIDREVSRYVAYDLAGEERMHRTLGTAERSYHRHQESLQRTSARVEREMESDVKRWHEEIPKRRKYVRGQWETRSESIPRTWALMVY